MKIELEFKEFTDEVGKTLTPNKKYLVIYHHDLTMLKKDSKISSSIWGQYKHESPCIWRDIPPQSKILFYAEVPEDLLKYE